MKYGAMIGWIAALCGSALSSAPAMVPEKALKGMYYLQPGRAAG